MRRGEVATHHLALFVRRRHDGDWWLQSSSVKFQKLVCWRQSSGNFVGAVSVRLAGKPSKSRWGGWGSLKPESKFGREAERLELPQLHAKPATAWSYTSHKGGQATFCPPPPWRSGAPPTPPGTQLQNSPTKINLHWKFPNSHHEPHVPQPLPTARTNDTGKMVRSHSATQSNPSFC